MFKHLFFLFVLLCAMPQAVFAQSKPRQSKSDWLTQRSSLRVRAVHFQKDTVALDTLTILNSYTSVTDSLGTAIDIKNYTIENGCIIWHNPLINNTLYIVKYRVLPFKLEAASAHKDTAWFLAGGPKPNKNGSDYDYSFRYDPYKNKSGRSSLDARGLDYSGSLSRGVSVGNAQDLVVNSQLNLQLSGKIGDDIEILGSISDQNIPLQPEGNTQRLQQFDKIFLQIKRKNATLIVGDYDLQRPLSYFTNYNRRLQGGRFSYVVNNSRKDSIGGQRQAYDVSGAVSRGRFVRQNITAIEGNQGPYRLNGANNERFVIILAGTEKVFIDGVLLKRGQDNDYTINYNSGEVFFTTRQLITKDKRIVVEFTYTEQKYTRFVTSANTVFETKKWDFHAHFFSESDSKNLNGQDSIPEDARKKLSEIGDSLQYAFTSGVRKSTEGYNPKQIQYTLRDTVLYQNQYQYYGIATKKDSFLYNISFSEVGANKGNYTIDTRSTANGRVYKWVAPDSITQQPRGNYAPLVGLTPPKAQQLYAFGGGYHFSKNVTLKTEVAVSNKDLNQFSKNDKTDDIGVATKVVLSYLPQPTTATENRWTSNLNYEYVQRTFNQIDPYRSVEFARDWNTFGLTTTDEHWFGASAGLQNNNWGNILYNASILYKDTVYNGFKNEINFNVKYKKWNITSASSYLQSQSKKEKTEFLRPNLNIFTTFYKNKLKAGAYAESERNARRLRSSDTLSRDSRFYYLYRAYLQTNDTTKFNFAISAQHRDDWSSPLTTDFSLATRADDATLSGGWQASKAQNLRWNFTYRQLAIADSTLTDTKNGQSIYLGRMDYSLRLWRTALVFQNIYELGNGQEQRIEYTYREVPAGQGQYIWIDRNNDGVQQLNEFEVSVFADKAKYVRYTTFTGRYVRSDLVNISQTLQLTPRAYWNTTTNKYKQFLNRFSTQTSVQINRKTLANNAVKPFNPYQTDIADTSLVSTNSTIRNTLFFNKIEQIFGGEWTYVSSANKQVLASGFERRDRSEHEVKVRYNPSPTWSITSDANTGKKGNDSQLFDDRDYSIAYFSIAPKLTWLYKQKLRIAGGYEYNKGINTIGKSETALSNNYNIEATFAQAASSSFNAKISAINMQYTGVENSPVGFALLEGLQNGQNLLWNLTWDKTIGKNLQVSVTYEGRKTGNDAPIVHVGRMQVRAIF
jgi:hypothetical protein